MKQASLVNVNEVKAQLQEAEKEMELLKFMCMGSHPFGSVTFLRLSEKMKSLFDWAKEKDETETK